MLPTLGSAESAKLEFKGSEVLSDPYQVGRAVTALLNAGGGELWVGIREEQGRAVGYEPLEDSRVEQRRTALRDHLIDTIDPPLTREVDITCVPVLPSGQVLRLEVSPAGGRPYSQMKGTCRTYWIRVQDRTRTMSDGEIQEAYDRRARSSSNEKDTLKAAEKALLDELEALRRSEHKALLWIRTRVQPALELQLHEDLVRTELEALLTDPRRSGNRPSGWSLESQYVELSLIQDGMRGRGRARGGGETEIGRDGSVRMLLPLEHLYFEGPERTIWPLGLVEYVVSRFRLQSAVLRKWGAGREQVVSMIALLNVTGWKIPFSPLMLMTNPPLERLQPHGFPEPDFVGRPHWTLGETLLERPDACALEPLAEIYRAVGFGLDAFPPEYDRAAGRLSIPA